MAHSVPSAWKTVPPPHPLGANPTLALRLRSEVSPQSAPHHRCEPYCSPRSGTQSGPSALQPWPPLVRGPQPPLHPSAGSGLLPRYGGLRPPTSLLFWDITPLPSSEGSLSYEVFYPYSSPPISIAQAHTCSFPHFSVFRFFPSARALRDPAVPAFHLKDRLSSLLIACCPPPSITPPSPN